MKELQHIQAALSTHPLFAGLESDTLTALWSRGVSYHLDAGEILYKAHHPADAVFVVLEGALQIEYPKYGETRGFVTAILQAPAFLGECQVLHEQLWSGTGVALAPLVALGLSRAALEALILEMPELGLRLYRELSLRFLKAIDSWKTQPQRTPAQALARYVLGVLEVLGSDASGFAMRQAELGQAAGLRRETVNRILTAWSREGRLAVDANGVSEVRRERLEELVSVDDTVLVQSMDLALVAVHSPSE